MVIQAPPLTFRTIDPVADSDLAADHHRDACEASFGTAVGWIGRERYLADLARRVEEYPDGHVLAFRGAACVGQLELEVPYGSATGYASLYYVAEAFRGQGFGRLLHQYAVRYFRSWEAVEAKLHVSSTNTHAVEFYRHMGYRLTRAPHGPRAMWTMTCRVRAA